jgi:hypothetical protein
VLLRCLQESLNVALHVSNGLPPAQTQQHITTSQHGCTSHKQQARRHVASQVGTLCSCCSSAALLTVAACCTIGRYCEGMFNDKIPRPATSTAALLFLLISSSPWLHAVQVVGTAGACCSRRKRCDWLAGCPSRVVVDWLGGSCPSTASGPHPASRFHSKR